MFDEMTAEASFVRIEEEVQRFWRRQGLLPAGLPEEIRTARRDGPRTIIYQQPISVVGQPWAEQVRLLATGDLFARYGTMRGDAVHTVAGWAGHGLQVEVAVERSLESAEGSYDLAQFNTACRKAAIRGLQQGKALAERLAVWSEQSGSYVTLNPQSIGTVWRALQRLWDAGRLRKERRIASVCPRCATPLSRSEATRHSVEAQRSTVWVRLPWDSEPNAYFLAWTPVPWTLVGMVALAAHPDIHYALIELASQQDAPPIRVLLAETALASIPTGDYQLVRRVRGRSLRGARYHPPFTFLPVGEGIDRVVLSPDVPLDQGTGLVPVTPAFDAPSLALAQTYQLTVPQLVDDWGNLGDTVTRWRGLSPLDAEPLIMEALRARGLLEREQTGMHNRALCPYCETALLPLARSTWLVDAERGPWVIGRDRAWGAPMPVWICRQCGEELCLAGLDDLAHRTGIAPDTIDPHRPAVDQLTFPCDSCGGTMQRTAAVVDANFEAAVLPLSAAGPPAEPPDKAEDKCLEQSLAIGLGDKSLGWLADLAEVASLLPGSPTWEQAVALSEGGWEAAWDLEGTLLADPLRWAVYAGTNPDQAEGGFLRSVWRLVADVGGTGDPSADFPQRQGPAILDRWLAARLYQTLNTVTDALDANNAHQAASDLAAFVSDMADWYTVYRPGRGGEALAILSRVLAPFTPHLAEAIHRQLGGRPIESIHRSDWPLADPTWADSELLEDVAQVRRLAALGRTARAEAAISADRLLPRALVCSTIEQATSTGSMDTCQDLLAEVLSVAQVQFTPDAMAQVEWHLALNPEQVVKRQTTPEEIETALAGLAPNLAADLSSQLREGLSASLEVAGQLITLLPDEVRSVVRAHPGWAAAVDARYLVVLEVG